MRRILPCLISTCTVVWGQFESLSTVRDGSVAFFTTRLSQTATDQPAHGKLFYIDAAGTNPLLIVDRQVNRNTTGFFGPDSYTTNIYDLSGVDIAANGSKITVIGRRECSGFTSGLCVSGEWSTIYDDLGNQLRTVPGNVLLSRNGKWGLQVLNSLTGSLTYTILDLESGESFPGPSSQSSRHWRRSSIADDGTSAVITLYGLYIVRPQYPPLMLVGGYNVDSATLDARGTSLFAWVNGKYTLYRLSASGPPAVLSKEELDDGGNAPMMSEDGSRVLFLAGSQIYVKDLSPVRPARRIGSISEGVASAVLSGDGSAVWALSNTGRVLKIGVGSREVQQPIGPVATFLPERFPFQIAYVPGHVITLPVNAAATIKDDVRFGDIPTPILKRTSEGVTVQIPWNIEPQGTHWVSLRGEGAEFWSGPSASLRISDMYPEFSLIWDGRDYVTRADRGSLTDPVTTANPARSGKSVRLYGKGFGPVTPPVATGTPAPDPPPTLASPLACYMGDSRDRLVSGFAGLAPGEIGVYRVDLVLPRIEKAGKVTIECQFPLLNRGAWTYKATLPVVP